MHNLNTRLSLATAVAMTLASDPHLLPTPGFRGHSGNPRGVHFEEGATGGQPGGTGTGTGAGATGGQGGEGGQGGAGTGEKKKVTFDADQQLALQAAIDEAVGRSGRTSQKTIDDLTAKLEAAMKQPEPKPGEKKGGQGGEGGEGRTVPEADVQRMVQAAKDEAQKTIDALQTKIDGMLGKTKEATIVDAASKLNAFVPKQIARLIADAVSYGEDGELIVVKEDGKTLRYGTGATPMTVEELVGEFLDQNPHLVKSSGQRGAGSGGDGQQAGTGGKVDTSKMSPSEKIAFGIQQRNKGAAR